MNVGQPTNTDDHIDAHVDAEIAACLDLAAPRSFFLFAGAGSGKTRSLVTALRHIQKTFSETLRWKGQRVAVITFTNAASDEITRRLLFDPLLDVRTIHSFAWSLIEGLNHDIREWLRIELEADIRDLRETEAKGRKGTKASAARIAKIESKSRRLRNLNIIRRFVYSPTGDNRTRDSLNHAEVIRITADFLERKPAMQSILVGRYPIILVDESQDTNKYLIDALFAVEKAQRSKFALGLVGDMMQRIYSDGKEGLAESLPEGWATPSKRLNYRCPRRIINLINRVRSVTDNQQQEPRSDAEEGFVRLFVLPSTTPDKPAAERDVRLRMAQITGDQEWTHPAAVKTLTLEHRMAAARMGFLEMFSPLYNVETWRTSFLEGKLPLTHFFTHECLPLVRACESGDQFAIARIAKAFSPLLRSDAIREAEDKKLHLEKVRVEIDLLMDLWKDGADPTLRDVLRRVARSNLLEIPDSLKAHSVPEGSLDDREPEAAEQEDYDDEREEAIEAFLDAPFSQVEPFITYRSGEASFDTHQGVKGLEFDRVMVIMDDAEARGFSFKYEDLFGGKSAGERAVEATRRLFYVTCSRAKRSLALVAYSGAPERVREFVLQHGWFGDAEILLETLT